jgi:hypothetical protein
MLQPARRKYRKEQKGRNTGFRHPRNRRVVRRVRSEGTGRGRMTLVRSKLLVVR